MDTKAFKHFLNYLYEGVYIVDKNRTITFWNKSAEKITGFSADEVIGKSCYDNILNHIDQRGCKLCVDGCPLHKTINDKKIRDANVYLQHKDGHRVEVSIHTIPIEDENGVTGAAEIFVENKCSTNIFEELEALKAQAYKDHLTDLPNRRYLDNYISTKINDYKKLGINFGILFFDVDHFKKFNDTYGHDVGDKYLQLISKICKSNLRSTDMVGRWGGEEFLVVISNTSNDELYKYGEEIRILVENSSLRQNKQDIKATISIGGTMFKEDDTIDSIIKRVDNLMYKSKEQGRNTVTIK